MLITSEAPWDPKVLDYVPPIEWYTEQPQVLKLIEESIFDQHGEYKDSTTPDLTKEDQILDAETPTDDPNYKAPIETSKSDMRVYLHNLIKGETIPEYRIFFAGRQVLEIDIDHRVALPTRRVHWDPSVMVRRSPRDHPSPIECPVKPRARKKTNILVPQDREALVGVPIKTMNGNPLGQSNDLSTDDQVEIRTDYNNPAKVNDHDMKQRLWTAAPRTKLKKEDATIYKKFFLRMPTKTIEKTFDATTRLGRIISGEVAWLRNSIKAPKPALNVKRRNEPVAMDTMYGPVGHPAITHGSTHAQFFIGRISNYRSTYHCGKSDKDVHRCILDEIRRLGAMDVLVSDRAQAQISKKVHDVLRTFAIKDRQSEPHNKNQNYAERGWKDTKLLSNRVLDTSGAPCSAWFLALK